MEVLIRVISCKVTDGATPARHLRKRGEREERWEGEYRKWGEERREQGRKWKDMK